LTSKQKRVINWHISNLEYANATVVDELSLQHWDQDDLFAYKGAHCLLRQGFGAIAQSLRQQIIEAGGKIVLGAKVTEIKQQVPKESTQNPAKVAVTVETDESNKIYSGDYCVITLPLGVLKEEKSIFVPHLPVEKRAAIDRLGFGILNKVLLVFDSCFWDKSAHSIGFAPSQTGDFYMFVNLYRHTGKFALLGILAGDLALQVESMSDKAVISNALSVLRRMFRYRNIPKEPAFAYVTRWKSDSHSRGSYSFLKPGSSPDDMDILSTPVNECLFFAGEATNRKHPASAHGAVLSGRREARRISNIIAAKLECELPFKDEV